MIVYSKTTCAPCRTLKYMLDKMGVSYEVRDVESNDQYKQEWLQYAQVVPVVVHGETVVVGNNLAAIKALI